jgi:hypothetical protein
MILVIRHLVPKGFSGIAIFPFVFIHREALKTDAVFLNHERIHLRQQLELLVVPFFILYGLEFLFRLIHYRSWHMAYSNLSFEREAYSNEKDLNYLQSRSLWRFLKYLTN